MDLLRAPLREIIHRPHSLSRIRYPAFAKSHVPMLPAPPDAPAPRTPSTPGSLLASIRERRGALAPLIAGAAYAGGLAGRAASAALVPLAPLAPIGRYAGRVGVGAAGAVFFAGAASRAHAQLALGRAVLGAGRVAALGRASAKRLALLAGGAARPGSLADKAASAASLGAFVAIETYPLWIALIRMSGSHASAISPSDTASMNLSPLPLDHALIVSGQGSIDEASMALGKLIAGRRRLAKARAHKRALRSLAVAPPAPLAPPAPTQSPPPIHPEAFDPCLAPSAPSAPSCPAPRRPFR